MKKLIILASSMLLFIGFAVGEPANPTDQSQVLSIPAPCTPKLPVINQALALNAEWILFKRQMSSILALCILRLLVIRRVNALNVKWI